MGVMTMKMINSTSITSTIGVTLMFELTFLPSSRLTIAIPVLPASGFQIGLSQLCGRGFRKTAGVGLFINPTPKRKIPATECAGAA
jgi:hypothetical protein